MAIAVDSNNAGTNGSTGTSLTWSHTCAAGAVLIVTVMYQGNHTALSITYNGVAMTKSSAVIYDGGDYSASIWYLLSPSSGANDIVITKGNGKPIAGGSISFTGANTSAVGSHNTASGNDTSATVTVTTTGSGNGYVVDCVNGINTFTITGGQTAIGNYPDFGGDSVNDGAASYEAYASGADPTASYSHSSQQWWIVALEVMEAVTGPANVKTIQGLATASVKTVDGLAIASVKTINGLG